MLTIKVLHKEIRFRHRRWETHVEKDLNRAYAVYNSMIQEQHIENVELFDGDKLIDEWTCPPYDPAMPG